MASTRAFALLLSVVAAGCAAPDPTLIEDGDADDLAVTLPVELDQGDLPFQFRITTDESIAITVTRDEFSVGQVSVRVLDSQGGEVVAAPANANHSILDLSFSEPTDLLIEVVLSGTNSFNGTLSVSTAVEVVPPCQSEAYDGWLAQLSSTITSSGSTIDTNEEADLQALIDIKPCAQHLASYSIWLGGLSQLLSDVGSQIDANDAKKLDFWIAAIAEFSADSAYLEWLTVFTSTIASLGSTIDQQDGLRLEYVAAAMPGVSSGSVYQHWFEVFAAAFDATGAQMDVEDEARLAFYTDAIPEGADFAGYELFLNKLIAVITASGSTIDTNDQLRIDHISLTLPCLTDGAVEAESLWFSRVGDHPTQLQNARPAACE